MDYINKTPYKIKKKPSRYEYILLMITVCLIVLLYVFMNEKHEIKPVIKKNIHPTKIQLPELPKNKFQYTTLLTYPNNEKLSTEYKIPITTAYKVKCGSFRVKDRAQSLVSKLKPVVAMNIFEKKGWFIVLSTHFENKREAEVIKHQISRKTGIYDCLLQKQ